MSTEDYKSKSFKTEQLSKCPFTGAGTAAKFSAGRGQLTGIFGQKKPNLKILSQHSELSNPMGDKFNYSKEFKNLTSKLLKKDLKKLMTDSRVVACRLWSLWSFFYQTCLACSRYI